MKKVMLICTILTLVPLLAGCAYRAYPYRDGYYGDRYRYQDRDGDGYRDRDYNRDYNR